MWVLGSRKVGVVTQRDNAQTQYFTPERRQIIRELRAKGLSVPAISVILEIYHDTFATEHQIRYLLREKLGERRKFPPNSGSFGARQFNPWERVA